MVYVKTVAVSQQLTAELSRSVGRFMSRTVLSVM